MFNVCKNMCRRKTFALIIYVSTKFFTRVQNIILQAFQTQSLLSTGRKCSWVWTFWSQARRLFSCLGSLQWMRQLQKVWEWLLPSIITKEGERGHGWELEFPKNDFLHLTWLISSPNEWKFSICSKTQNSRKDQSEVLGKKWRFTYTSRQNNDDWCINSIQQLLFSVNMKWNGRNGRGCVCKVQ